MSEVEEQIRGIHDICEHRGYVVMCFEAYLAIRDVWSVVDPANEISVGKVDDILTSHVTGNEVLIIYTYPNSPGSERVYLEECHVVQSYNQKLNINKVHVQMWRFHWNQQKKERVHTTIGLAGARIAGSTIVNIKHVPILTLQEVKH